MVAKQKGLFAVWTDIPTELEYEFNDWYNRGHVRDRVLGISGFKRGRRFISYAGGPKYLAIYDVESVEVLRSKPYIALISDPDPLSRKFIPLFQNTIKGICDITAESGEAEGAVAGMLLIERIAGRENELREWITTSLLPELLRTHGIVAARYAEKNAAALAAGTAQHMRRTDIVIDAVLMVEATSEANLSAALPLVGRHVFAIHGGKCEGEARQLRVAYTLHASSGNKSAA